MQYLNKLKDMLGKGLDLISPCKCICCGLVACSDDLPVCSDCLGDFYRLLNTACRSCGMDICRCDCHGEKLAFLFWYDTGLSHHIVGQLKNNADLRFARFLSRLLVLRIKSLHKRGFEAVTYIPRRKRGIRIAGYDQAKLIADETAKCLGIPCIPMLIRHGRQEQKLLSAAERKKRMKDRYSVVLYNQNNIRRVLLIDDVSTTGATLSACAGLLRRAGIGQVIPAVVAKTPKKEGWITNG